MSSGGNLERFDFDDMNLDSPDAIGQDIYVGNTEKRIGLGQYSDSKVRDCQQVSITQIITTYLVLR
jgi:hypothetical protein